MFQTVRLLFTKTGSARYISHLDLTRCMARAIKLSGLPVWYTEGFNPHIYMTFAMPLSLGTVGERELMDIRLNEPVPFDELTEALNRRLPADIRVLRAGEPVKKLEDIARAEYAVSLESGDPQGLYLALRGLLAREEITVTKHGKKGDRQVDIKPDFAGADPLQEENGVSLALSLPCTVSGAVNPALLLDALRAEGCPDFTARIVRRRLLAADGTELW